MGAMAGGLDSAFREAGGGSDQHNGDVTGEGKDGDADDIISNTHGFLRASRCSGCFAHRSARIPHDHCI